MLAHVNLRNLIFLDIETVPQQSRCEELSVVMQELWERKHSSLRFENENYVDGYLKRAGVYAEFAKIICISIGFMHFDKEKNKNVLRIKSISGDDEKALLSDFSALLQKSFRDFERYRFCGHNIREFDIPFICRRLLVNHLDLPELFDNSGKRPWEMVDVDTLQLWKFGDYKSYTSLKLLTEILGIPSPKNDIDGKDVCRVYWEEKNLPRIVEYCQRDVATVARLMMHFKGEKQKLEEEDITIVS